MVSVFYQEKEIRNQTEVIFAICINLKNFILRVSGILGCSEILLVAKSYYKYQSDSANRFGQSFPQFGFSFIFTRVDFCEKY